MTQRARAELRDGLQLIRKSLLWLSGWLKRIARGAIGGYKEAWPTSATIWHTTQSGTFLKNAASSHLRKGRGRRRGGEVLQRKLGKNVARGLFPREGAECFPFGP